MCSVLAASFDHHAHLGDPSFITVLPSASGDPVITVLYYSQPLPPPFPRLLEALPFQPAVHADEANDKSHGTKGDEDGLQCKQQQGLYGEGARKRAPTFAAPL